MDRGETISVLQKIIGDYLSNQGFELVEFIYRHEGRDLILRILTDRPEGGISLDECAQLNTEISTLLDEEDKLQERYVLEVSSPGLDRPLRTKSDFLRCVGRKAIFFLREPVGGRIEFSGVITKVGEEAVSIEAEGRILEIPIAKINKAKQEI